MFAESKEEVIGRCLVQSVYADVVVAVWRVVEGQNVAKGLGGIRW